MAFKAPCSSDLRHRMALQSPRENRGAGGDYGDPWASPIALGTISAQITPVSGYERLKSAQLESPVTHRIVTRYRSDITHKCRLVYESRIFNIRAVIDPTERKRWLEIKAEEGVAT